MRCLRVATRGAGWRGYNELGRRIKEGEKEILIYAPILSEHTKADADSEQPQQELLGFRPVRVFDVAQTEGEELSEPSLFDNLDLAATLAKLIEFAGSQGIKIQYSDNIAPAKGTSYRRVIRLQADMEARETISVFVRDLAVQMLYETHGHSFVTRDVLLREAKAVAFVVGEALSLRPAAAENIQLYRGNQNLTPRIALQHQLRHPHSAADASQSQGLEIDLGCSKAEDDRGAASDGNVYPRD